MTNTTNTINTPATVTLNQARFNDLIKKLRELFELDKADLDFGIYRIMAAKNKEVTDFLNHQLKDILRETLGDHAQAAAADIQKKLDDAIAQAQSLGADPDTLPKVKVLKEQLATTGDTQAAKTQLDVYNHLIAFFSRYYDEGDFISKRRYKNDVYAIPYNGQEVALHWANKDQYYIKSGEWHKDYRFTTPGSAPGSASKSKSVRFQLIDATNETNNNKEKDDAKRRYILTNENPVQVTDNQLTLRFEFRVPTDADKKRAAADAVAIFGGKYAGTTKGDEREQFSADAEQRALPHIPPAWLPLVNAAAATEAKPALTLLGKHLNNFTARNTFDYFIHKDLHTFLSRELDFYIKNEVVRLDDLEKLPPDHLTQVQRKVKAIRTVASKIIDFLASIEDFQKKMWLKKKLVLETNWLVTIDRLPAKLRDVVAANKDQWAAWRDLGFEPAADKKADAPALITGPSWGSRAYLDANDKLVVDTKFFPKDFKAQMLASEEVTQGKTIDEATSGMLINSENFQAISLLQTRYDNQINCMYIDPPYNTGDDGFPYKDGYLASSWYSMIIDRISASCSLLSSAGAFFLQIGDEEAARSRLALEDVFAARKNSAVARRGIKNVQAQFADIDKLNQGYDLIHIYTKTSGVRMPHLYQKLDDEKPGKWDTFWRGVDRPTMRYPFFGQNPKKGQWRWEVNRANRAARNFEHYLEQEANAKTLDEWYVENLQAGTDLDFVRFNDDEVVQYYVPPQNYRLVSDSWLDIPATGSETDFPHEKSVALMKRIVGWTCPSSGTVLDFFAGSGTTGRAVISMNRTATKQKKFILVEMGAYFHTVLKPRIAKVLYSPDWKDGKAQTHGSGTSALVKYFALESYEDALNNLPAPTGGVWASAYQDTRQSLMTYSLDLELGPKLLNLDVFNDPWGYQINAQLAGEEAIRPCDVDLVETFNYLLGLKVHAYGSIERFEADFETAKHPDGMGKLKVKGRLKRSDEGKFVFQRIEGVLNDSQDTRVLVVWRTVTGEPEQDAAVLEAWMARYSESTRDRSEHRQYQQIYVNGPVTLAQPGGELRTVYPIEQTFKDKMFEGTDAGSLS